MKYTKDHEWIKVDGDTATIGISLYAAKQLGDIVYVEMPEAGRVLAKGDDAAVVESVKAASDVFAPISGTVSAHNEALEEVPEIVNQDPENVGWFYKMSIDDASELSGLMDAAAYKTFCDGLE